MLLEFFRGLKLRKEVSLNFEKLKLLGQWVYTVYATLLTLRSVGEPCNRLKFEKKVLYF